MMHGSLNLVPRVQAFTSAGACVPRLKKKIKKKKNRKLPNTFSDQSIKQIQLIGCKVVLCKLGFIRGSAAEVEHLSSSWALTKRAVCTWEPIGLV